MSENSLTQLGDVLLVIPCFNEEARLATDEFLEAANSGLYLCFANDGSTDKTLELLKTHFDNHPRIFIFEAPKNLGKAEVLRSAILDLYNKSIPQSKKVKWVGFWDADLATPLSEVPYFLDFQKTLAPNTKALFGSRLLRLGAHIERSAQRHYLGRIFATFASILLDVNSYDSQCGAKLFDVQIASGIFTEAFVSKWIFDLELLLRIGEENVVEVPLRKWTDIPGSKVKVFKESLRVFSDLLAIRKKYIQR
jgi:glycosyltransferase involved in cell wall biosynthesis